MNEPIVVYENGDIMIFKTVAEAELALEAEDVKNGAYIVYDRSGMVLDVSTREIPSIGLFAIRATTFGVKICEPGGASRFDSKLKIRLQQFYNDLQDVPDDLSQCSLNELIHLVLEKTGFSI